jgi:hypothetical protein
MFERFITRLTFILFGIIVFMAISNTARANDAFIYYNSNDTGAEYSRLKSHLEGLGFTVTGSTSTTVSSSDVSGQDLVIDIAGTSNCGSTCRSVYDSYVSGGGKLIIAAPAGASNRQSNIESLIENKMSVGTMTYYSSTCSTDLCWQSYKRSGYTTTGVTDYLPGAGQLFQASGGTAMASNSASSTYHTWYKWDYGSNGGTIIVAMGYDQFQTNLSYTSSMTSFLTEIAEDEGLYSSTPTYTSSISSAQTTQMNNARGVTHNGNAIYINQVGNSNSLTIDQDGNDNLIAGVGTTTNSILDADITGNNNTTTLSQIGDNNVMLFDITGDYNSTTIDQGGTAGADDNRLEFDINGDYNTLSVTQKHNNGIGNNGHFFALDLDGDSNNILASQLNDGDKKAFLSIQGDDNDIDLIQQGTGSHYVEISTGSDQTVDITQDGSGQHNASVNMTGYSSTLDLTQSGSTGQVYSINQNCLTSTGCGTTTVTQQ